MTIATIADRVPARDRPHDRALVRSWLYAVAFLVIAMVFVGGATRLTHSGLSITEWQPIHGVIPPLSTADWQEEFAKYQQIPEYQQLNRGMTLGEFKSIFWWEWSHRLLGRFIGFAVLIPLVFLWATGRIERSLLPKIAVMLALGSLQGAVGWWMVASGLVERTDVSQYRLATHLVLACIIFAYILWVARSIAPEPVGFRRAPVRLRFTAAAIVAMTFVQIYLGALVAGLDAGLVFNTWPLMDGRLVPEGAFSGRPLWRDLFENVTTVQFDHRLGAYVLFALTLFHAVQAMRAAPASRHAAGAGGILALVLVQAGLGISALLLLVPLPIALLHQLVAVAILGTAIVHLRGMTAPLPATG